MNIWKREKKLNKIELFAVLQGFAGDYCRGRPVFPIQSSTAWFLTAIMAGFESILLTDP